MKSYAGRRIFTRHDLGAWYDAVDLVRRIATAAVPQELRCHELARAVHAALGALGRDTQIVDGMLGAIEHSWLLVQPLDAREPGARSILDVDCPGRVPQVQLIHQHHVISHDYAPGVARTDIDARAIAELKRLLGIYA